MGTPTLTPGLTRPPDSTSTVARSSASRSGFSQPSGVTAVPSSMRVVRCDAAAMTATGEEMPYCRCRCRSHALSKPSRSPSSMMSSVVRWPGAGSFPSKSPMVRKPSRCSAVPGVGMGSSLRAAEQPGRIPPRQCLEHVLAQAASSPLGQRLVHREHRPVRSVQHLLAEQAVHESLHDLPAGVRLAYVPRGQATELGVDVRVLAHHGDHLGDPGPARVTGDEHEAGAIAGHLIELDGLILADREADAVVDARV